MVQHRPVERSISIRRISSILAVWLICTSLACQQRSERNKVQATNGSRKSARDGKVSNKVTSSPTKQPSIEALQFQVLKTDPAAKPLFSDRHEIFVGVVEKAEELSAYEAFQYLRRLPRAEKASQEPPNRLMVGRLNGEVYSIDSFDVQSVKQSG